MWRHAPYETLTGQGDDEVQALLGPAFELSRTIEPDLHVGPPPVEALDLILRSGKRP